MNKTKHTASFEIAQPVNDLFPLFSPEGEKLWVPGWDYENIMGGTDIHENYVFLTRNHDHASAEAVWIVKKYDPKEHCIQLYKIEPEYKVGIIEVTCIQLSSAHTKIQVSYEYIGLSDKGNQFIEGFTSSAYKSFIEDWKDSLITYFRTES
ncbi:MAG TPA: hypothetical protein ENI97_03240 [Gammaproteobacteria bacterium]|nr:hypothetical protein [Gammaproteobacteria bacterium]